MNLTTGTGDTTATAGAVVKEYVDDLTQALAGLDVAAATGVLTALTAALRAGHTVLIAGNGGSSTAAVHIAADLTAASGGLEGAPHAAALTENVARLTAIANDHSFEEVFARQLAGRGGPGDVLLLLSVSGQSANLVRAAETGRALGMTVLAALGYAGALAGLADRTVVFGQADYGLTEDLHVALGHMAVRILSGGEACRYRPGGTGEAVSAAEADAADDPAEGRRAL